MSGSKIIRKILKDYCKSKGFKIEEQKGDWIGFKPSINSEMVLAGFYHIVGDRYNVSGTVSLSFPQINRFIEDYNGGEISRLYDPDLKKLQLIYCQISDYLQINYGEENYPNGIYTYFIKEQVEQNPEFVLDYLEKEFYEKVFLDIEEKYGTIAKADKTINEEILANGFVKKHSIGWLDYTNQCIRSILCAHFNMNPHIDKLIEICNKTMLEEKNNKPDNPRIPLYNFILKKLGFQEI